MCSKGDSKYGLSSPAPILSNRHSVPPNQITDRIERQQEQRLSATGDQSASNIIELHGRRPEDLFHKVLWDDYSWPITGACATKSSCHRSSCLWTDMIGTTKFYWYTTSTLLMGFINMKNILARSVFSQFIENQYQFPCRQIMIVLSIFNFWLLQSCWLSGCLWLSVLLGNRGHPCYSRAWGGAAVKITCKPWACL